MAKTERSACDGSCPSQERARMEAPELRSGGYLETNQGTDQHCEKHGP